MTPHSTGMPRSLKVLSDRRCSTSASDTALPMFFFEKVSEAVTRTPPSTCSGPRRARSRPCWFSHRALYSMPGFWRIFDATSSASAMVGTRLGFTYETQLMCLSPVSASASMRRTLSATGITFFSDWKPSRGPSSAISTRLGKSDIDRLLGASALFLEGFFARLLDTGQGHQDEQERGGDQEAEADRPFDEHHRIAPREQH